MLLAKSKNGNTAWHRASIKGILEAFEILWLWGKKTGLNPDDILLSKNEEGINVLHCVANGNQLDILQKFSVCAEVCELNPKELKKILLFSKSKEGCTVPRGTQQHKRET